MLSSNLFLVVIVRKCQPTLETGFYDSAILHVGVNDLLNDKLPSSIDDLVSDLVDIVNKCKSFGVMDLFVSGIAFDKRLPYTFLNEKLMKKLQICVKRKVQFLLLMEISLIWIYTKMAYTYWNELMLISKEFYFLY